MKIESSTIFMDSVHTANRHEKATLSSGNNFRSAPSDTASSSTKHANKKASDGELIFYLSESSSYSAQTHHLSSRPQELFADEMGQFHHRLFRHIIEMMKEMLAGNNTHFSEASEFLTFSSENSMPHLETQIWHRETTYTSHLEEREYTRFGTNGLVQTSDGREISFHLDVGMSRSFIEEMKLTTLEDTEMMVMKDPLVINLDLPTAAITDQKFLFDIDSDGIKESLSSLAKGCGFLALDKNGDGKINNGNELFGTESGDGFYDLSQYDEDGNGWIDENDSVFSKLKIWTKNPDGTDRLLNLSEADVGAIFLGHLGTEFQLNDNLTNETNAKIQSSGIFLHESTGAAGTIQHVDFATSSTQG